MCLSHPIPYQSNLFVRAESNTNGKVQRKTVSTSSTEHFPKQEADASFLGKSDTNCRPYTVNGLDLSFEISSTDANPDLRSISSETLRGPPHAVYLSCPAAFEAEALSGIVDVLGPGIPILGGSPGASHPNAPFI
jgi:hypothetical protein